MMIHKRTLGDIAASTQGATRVFLRNRLDFCCKGQKLTLKAACAEAGLDLTQVATELAEESVRESDILWESRPLPELAQYIQEHYHDALRRDVPSLIEAAAKVERVHADKPTVPAGLADSLREFWREMTAHMAKEEEVLFPLVSRGEVGKRLGAPISVMTREHEDHGRELEKLRRLTTDYTPPAGACATWRALYDGLANLERELMEHIHLENNVLFPRALASLQ